VTPVNIKENAMENGVRKSLEIVLLQDFRDSCDEMDFTGERVQAAETPLTERWLQDESCEALFLQVCTTGTKNYYCGPLHNDRELTLKWVGHCGEYSVEEARAKAECLTKNITLGTIPRRFGRSMRSVSVFREYLQETDLNNPLTPFFDYLVPGYGLTPLSGIGKERWISLIKEASKDLQIDQQILHRRVKGFLDWVVKRQQLRRNPLSGTSIPPSLEDLNGHRLFRLLETPTVSDSNAK
jgi:hypothetical protein